MRLVVIAVANPNFIPGGLPALEAGLAKRFPQASFALVGCTVWSWPQFGNYAKQGVHKKATVLARRAFKKVPNADFGIGFCSGKENQYYPPHNPWVSFETSLCVYSRRLLGSRGSGSGQFETISSKTIEAFAHDVFPINLEKYISAFAA